MPSLIVLLPLYIYCYFNQNLLTYIQALTDDDLAELTSDMSPEVRTSTKTELPQSMFLTQTIQRQIVTAIEMLVDSLLGKLGIE